ncbi:MAG: ABC transporter ATP-binding protein [Anaerolineales bacterium]
MSDRAVWAIETKDLWRVYPCRSGAASEGVPALRGIDLKVKTGTFVVLRGRSGSGKTTLLNCLAGLDRPTSGEVRILDRNLVDMTDQELTIWRREEIGLVFQSFGLLATLSTYENVELLLRIKGTDPQVSHRRTMDCLEMVGLTRWRDHRPYEMSGGQQQRVAIARALANNARLILADEPTGELDSKTGHEILSFLRNLVDTTHITLLMASHDPLVDKYAQHVLTLQDGAIAAPQKQK